MWNFSIVLKYLESENKSQRDLAEYLGVSEQKVSDWKSGRLNSWVKRSAEIGKFFGVPASTFDDSAYKNNAYPTFGKGVKIPVLGIVQAGIPVEAVENIIDYEEITQEMAKNGDHFALQIRGDSMEPKFSEGDVVIVRKQPCVDTGDIAIVLINGEAATCKKIKRVENGIWLIPNNHAYDAKFYSDKEVRELPIEILGRVVELRAKF